MYVVLRCPLPGESFEGLWPLKIKAEELIESLRQKALALGVPLQVEIMEQGRRRVLALSPEGMVFEGALFAPHKVRAGRRTAPVKTGNKRRKP